MKANKRHPFFRLSNARRIMALWGIFLFSMSGHAQDLEGTLQQLSEDAAKMYVMPISSALATNVNGAWFHKAPKAQAFGFDLEIGVVAMGSFFPTDRTRFETTGQFTFSVSEAQNLVSGVSDPQIRNELIAQLTTTPSTVNISGATIIGSSNDYITISFPGGTYQTSYGQVTLPSQQIQLPVAGFGELAEVNLLPLATPQVTVGTVMGTQAVLRYLPSTAINDDLGKLSYFGFGIQHNPLVWLGGFPFPVDVAVGFYRQNAALGDVFSLKATAYGLNISKQFGTRFFNITPYAGYLVEQATMQVNYAYVVDTPGGPISQEIAFELEGENKSRIVLGINLRFLLINLNLDYNLGTYDSITAGLNLAL